MGDFTSFSEQFTTSADGTYGSTYANFDVKDPPSRDVTYVSIETTLHILTTLVGLVGHILVVVITLIFCRKWRVLHYLLMGVSCTEILVLIGFSPLHMYGVINRSWDLPSEVCTFSMAFLHTGSGVTSGFKTIMGLSRLILCSSEQLYIRCFGKGMVIASMAIWAVLVVLLVDTTLIAGFVEGEYNTREYQCSLSVPQTLGGDTRNTVVTTRPPENKSYNGTQPINMTFTTNDDLPILNVTFSDTHVSLTTAFQAISGNKTRFGDFGNNITLSNVKVSNGYSGSDHIFLYTIIIGIFFFMTSAINALSYTIVYCKIKFVNTQETIRHNKDCKEILVSVILAYVNLFLFWTPWIVVNIIDVQHQWLPVALHKVAFYLHLLNYTTDPFIYAFRATDYKLGFFLLCNRHFDPHGSARSEDMYNIDFNDLGEEYNNNLSEVVHQMKTADEDGFDGIVKKQTIHRAKLRFQSSISQIIRDHRQQQEYRAKINRIRSQSTKSSPIPSPDGPRRESSVVHKWKRAVTIVRVRDLINLNIEDVVIRDQEEGPIQQGTPLDQPQSHKNIKNLRVNLRGIGRESQPTETGEKTPVTPLPKSA